jgi:hypothetical protein
MSRHRLRLSRPRGEQGYAAILVATFAVAVMLPLCAISVDIARMYVEGSRLQAAADAASMAGVTYLPDDLDAAKVAAAAVAGRNGFPNSGTSSVSATLGAKPTQLKVTVSSKIPNTFASSFGFRFATVSRSSVADYNGPAPMGSPCNAFGNEPLAGAAEPLGTGSQIVPPTGGAACTSSPLFWGAIAGPETPKGNGDAIMTRRCDSGTSGCTGTTNDQFDPLGYFYLVRVAPAAVGKPVTLQIYDPSFVETDDTCSAAPDNTNTPTGTTARNNMNPYTTDGNTRYQQTPGAYCTGDVLTSDTSDAPVTSFALRAPTDTYRPVNGTPITGCVKQYPGYREDETPSSGSTLDISSSRLRATKDDGTANGSYRPELAQVFHQWVNFCTFTPTQAGDHYLQVRTNVAMGGSSDGKGGFTGNGSVTTQMGDNTGVDGNGNNRFAIRATGPDRGSVSVAAWEEMGIYANYPGGATQFNLVRVIPAAASKTLIIQFFDVGDASSPGSIKVLPPIDSNLPTPVVGCVGSGVRTGNLANCELTNVSSSSGWNGQAQTIRVPIPTTYTCTSTASGGCWFRLQVTFPGGVSDTTTWSARVEGDPIRLIE